MGIVGIIEINSEKRAVSTPNPLGKTITVFPIIKTDNKKILCFKHFYYYYIFIVVVFNKYIQFNYPILICFIFYRLRNTIL